MSRTRSPAKLNIRSKFPGLPPSAGKSIEVLASTTNTRLTARWQAGAVVVVVTEVVVTEVVVIEVAVIEVVVVAVVEVCVVLVAVKLVVVAVVVVTLVVVVPV